MRFLPRLTPRFGLLGTFALISAVPVLLLGLVLATVLGNQIRERSIKSTVQGIEFATQAGLGSIVTERQLHRGDIGKKTSQHVDQALHAAQRTLPFARVNIWSNHEHLKYSSDPKLEGTTIEPSDELEEALDQGEPTTEILHASQPLETEQDNRDILKQHGDLLEVYVPFHFEHGKPQGAFEVYLPYAPLASAIQADTNRLYLILLVGLSLLYAIVFRVVARASRKPAHPRQGDERPPGAHQVRVRARPAHHLPNRTLFPDRLEQTLGCPTRGPPVRGDAPRPRPLQGGQRHARPPPGDMLLLGLGARLRVACATATPSRASAATSSPCCSPSIERHRGRPELAVKLRRCSSDRSRRGHGPRGRRQRRHRPVPRPRRRPEDAVHRADVAMYPPSGKRTGYRYQPQ